MATQPLMIPATLWPPHPPQRVFLARHGQSEWNAEERISGQHDPALSQKGQRQAQRLSTVLQERRLTKIVTSALTRSIDTARPTAESQGLTVCPMDALNEVSFGILEGQERRHLDDESQRLLDQWLTRKSHFRLPEGENLSDVWERAVPALSQVLADSPGGTLLIVGHRHTNLVILCALLGWDLHSSTEIPIHSKYVYEIHYDPFPCIHTICLTGKERGQRVQGFLTGDRSINASLKGCRWS